MSICPPTPYLRVAVSVAKDHHGRHTVTAIHYHDGDLSPCGDPESYSELTWGEAMDVADATIECHRPGVSPAGWEQLDIWS